MSSGGSVLDQLPDIDGCDAPDVSHRCAAQVQVVGLTYTNFGGPSGTIGANVEAPVPFGYQRHLLAP